MGVGSMQERSKLCSERSILGAASKLVCASGVKRAFSFLAGVLVALICFADSAYAFNGFTAVMGCQSCSSSTDFISAAVAEAGVQQGPGVYHVVSESQASSADIKVTGRWVTRSGGETFFVPRAGTPLDQSGNSLAAMSESDLETYFNSLDQTTYGRDRGGVVGNVNVPADYQRSFVCNCELEDMGAQVAGWISAQYHIVAETLKVGTIVTLVFSDGSKAQFQKISGTGTLRWQWNGKAWDAQGNRIDQNGNMVGNPNTSGAGAGEVAVPGFGAMSGVNFDLLDQGSCTYITTITINGVEDGKWSNIAPC